MDYEKAYKEALERAKAIYQDKYKPETSATIAEVLQNIFSELKESDEERIRKELISIVKSYRENCITEGNHRFDDCLAWLDKQKVLTTEEDLQGKEDVLWCIKQAKKHAKDENEMGTCWFAEKWLEKQGEQKGSAKETPASCALSFINYLDAHRYEGKMCVSNGECEDIEDAFHNAMWDKLHRYYCKYIEKQGRNQTMSRNRLL